FAPHAPYTVSDQSLKKIITLAEQLDVQIQMHIHETDDEINQSIDTCGGRPLQRLLGLGMLSPRLMAVHATQLEQHEINLMAKYAISVVHCPESNLKLASGFCPVHELSQAGVNVALGTDGAASNNDLDMLGEMRTAALLSKGICNDCTASPAYEILRMATINGARALALEQVTGSVEKGKQADLIAIDLTAPETQPLYDPVSQIVYAAGREQINHVWVAGRQLLRERELLTVDLQQLMQKAAEWREKIGGSGLR
ncbi:MAG: amidohydrolase family protein, partial [Gammaproteobacteria bacterium]